MSEACLVNIKCQVLDLLTELDDSEVDKFEQWIVSHKYRKDLHLKKILQKDEDKLIKIGRILKKIMPFEAEMPSENIIPPVVGDQADCNKVNTCHVDEFIYDEQETMDLVKKGKLKKQYCLDCNSRNTADLTLISHSMSRQTIQYIFKMLLPKDLVDKQILDVGSRIGAIIYGAYYFSNASAIIGIEMNKECCSIQEEIIGQFSMDANRIKVIHSDVMDRSDVVINSDVIVINVLDFFVDIEKHRQMWYFFKKHIKKGSYLVTNRSMADTLSYLDIFEEFMNWLTICAPNQIENEIFFDIEDNSEIYLYTVN